MVKKKNTEIAVKKQISSPKQADEGSIEGLAGKTVGLIIAFRVLNALLVRTFFQPDEYFQSWEKAHNDVFGYGQVTWEWKLSLRTSLVPVVFAKIFRLANLIGVDYLLAGKVFCGIIAAVGDIFTYKLALKVTKSRKIARYALWVSLASVFNFYAGTRAFSNTFEMVLTTICLYYWPMTLDKLQSNWHLLQFFFLTLLANVTVLLRPTNAALWGFMYLHLVYICRTDVIKLLAFSWVGSVGAIALQVAGNAFDMLYHKTYYPPVGMFLYMNIMADVASYYGVMPWHFYLTSALPMLLMTFLPFALWGLQKLGLRSLLVNIVLSQIALFSMVPHKEVRFLYFLLPLLHIAVATRVNKNLLQILTAINIPIALYLSLVHQRGVISVVNYIRDNNDIIKASFLMPCHSTPMHAHIHREDLQDHIVSLSCEPMVFGGSMPILTSYTDEADEFYQDPVKFLQANPSHLAPHLVFFEALKPTIEPILEAYGYTLEKSFFNSHFHEDPRRRGDVLVYSRPVVEGDEVGFSVGKIML